MSIGLALLDHFEDLVGRGDETFRDAFHVRHSIFVLVNWQVVLGHYFEKIK